MLCPQIKASPRVALYAPVRIPIVVLFPAEG